MPSGGMPLCPQWLDKVAKREWRRVAKELYDMGLLTKVDRAALAGYCEAHSRYLQAIKVLQEKGQTYSFTNAQLQEKFEKRPEEQIARDALNQIRQFCAEFGMTPSSRARMVIPKTNEPEDPMEELLKRTNASGN